MKVLIAAVALVLLAIVGVIVWDRADPVNPNVTERDKELMIHYCTINPYSSDCVYYMRRNQ